MEKFVVLNFVKELTLHANSYSIIIVMSNKKAKIEECIDLDSIVVTDSRVLGRTLTATLRVNGPYDPEIDWRVRDVADHFVDYLISREDYANLRGHGGQYDVSHTRTGRHNRYCIVKGFPIKDLNRVDVQIISNHDADFDIVSEYATHIKPISQ